MYAENPCGPLGPSASREIFAFDLTEVSTLVPYTDETASTRRATRQLHLSDLDTHCTRSFNRSELATQTRPLKDDDTRCNPFLTVPKKFKEYGYPYWLHCGIKNNKFGVFDPPYAIPALDELVPARTTFTQKPDIDNPTTAPFPSAKAPLSMGSVETAAHSLHNHKPASADPNNAGASASLKPIGSTTVSIGNTRHTPFYQEDSGALVSPDHAEAVSSSVNTKATMGESKNAEPTIVEQIDTGATDTSGNSKIRPDRESTEELVSYQGNTKASAVIAEHVDQTEYEEILPSAIATLNAQGSMTGPGAESDPTVSFRGVTSIVTKQVVSLGTAGLEVINSDTGETSTYAVPVAGGPQLDSGLVPASIVVYNGHTMTQGGRALTVTSAVVILPYPASSTETGATAIITNVDEDSSFDTTVAKSPANRVSHGVYSVVLAMLAYGWVHL
ncbi:hypothetical protein NW762_011114 [Fusarium torreyae]|uniref:Uncharacterized protein n=1 Tax=Fusarium torreyae TaxID=1237075 RepID=A0A9W8RTI0_9HYPO|nr:hypothetical protein NW762_011114 [Fusarium torreyae]